jgi:hypothetical protein
MGNFITFPGDPHVFWWLVSIFALSLIVGCVLSGAPFSALRLGSRSYLRAVLISSTAHGQPYFWFIWAIFCVALVTLIAAIMVGYAAFGTAR